jgi:hypothetical protein
MPRDLRFPKVPVPSGHEFLVTNSGHEFRLVTNSWSRIPWMSPGCFGLGLGSPLGCCLTAHGAPNRGSMETQSLRFEIQAVVFQPLYLGQLLLLIQPVPAAEVTVP